MVRLVGGPGLIGYSDTSKQRVRVMGAAVVDEVRAAGTYPRAVISPTVSWPLLALAYEPSKAPTQARLATLRRHDACTDGLRIALRSRRGVAGSRHLYSSLGLWSAILTRLGRVEDASLVTAQAREFEAELFAGWATATPTARQVRAFALRTLSISEAWTNRLGISQTPGEWTSVRGGQAIITSDDGSTFELPANAPYLQDSALGDPVVIAEERTVTGSELRYVLPAVIIDESSTVDVSASEADADADDIWREPIRDTTQSRDFFRTLVEEADRLQ